MTRSDSTPSPEQLLENAPQAYEACITYSPRHIKDALMHLMANIDPKADLSKEKKVLLNVYSFFDQVEHGSVL